MNTTIQQFFTHAPRPSNRGTKGYLGARAAFVFLTTLAGFAAHAADDPSRLGSVVAAKISLPKTASRPMTVSLDDPDVKRNADTDLDLFKNAIAKLKSTHASRLVIPKRVYNLKAEGITLNDSVINFNDLNDVTIEGNGAELDFNDVNVHAGIHVGHSSRILIQGLIMDWVPVLAYPGTVIHETDASGKSSSVFVVDKAYPIAADSPPAFTTLFQFDVQGRRYVESNQPSYDHMLGCPQNLSRCAKYLGQQRFALPQDSDINNLPQNASMLATMRIVNMGALIVDNGSADVTIRDLTIYQAPGAALAVINAGGGFHLQRVAITRKPDALLSAGEPVRMISAASDAINFISTEGNILIEDSEVGFEADDGLNIRGRIAEARVYQGDPQILQIKQWDPSAYIAGDALTIRDESTMALLAKGRIRDTQKNNDGTLLVTLDAKPAIPPATRLYVVSERLSSGNYVVRNSNFHDNKNRGLLLRGGPGLIADNKVSGTTSSGIQLGAEFTGSFAEGPPVHDVLVTRNTISGVNRGDYAVHSGTQKFPAAIMTYVTDNHNYMGPLNENFRIEDNTISNVPGEGIFIASSMNATVSNNTLQNINLKSYGDPKMNDVAIYVTQSSKISIERNHFVGHISVDQATTNAVSSDAR